MFGLSSGLDHQKRLRSKKQMSHGAAMSLRNVCHCLVGTLWPFSCAAAFLEPRPWAAAGRGLFSAALFAAPRCSPSPCSCVSPQVLRYVADQGETLFLRCAWNCLRGLEGHCHVHRQKAGDLGEENLVRNEMALLCPKHSDCAIRGSDCKLVFDGPVYGQLTLSPGWHTCTSM